jgi:hypothetical protein
MLAAQLHYPVFHSEFRGRQTPVAKRGIRRVFRIGDTRPAGREMGRR